MTQPNDPRWPARAQRSQCKPQASPKHNLNQTLIMLMCILWWYCRGFLCFPFISFLFAGSLASSSSLSSSSSLPTSSCPLAFIVAWIRNSNGQAGKQQANRQKTKKSIMILAFCFEAGGCRCCCCCCSISLYRETHILFISEDIRFIPHAIASLNVFFLTQNKK